MIMCSIGFIVAAVFSRVEQQCPIIMSIVNSSTGVVSPGKPVVMLGNSRKSVKHLVVKLQESAILHVSHVER